MSTAVDVTSNEPENFRTGRAHVPDIPRRHPRDLREDSLTASARRTECGDPVRQNREVPTLKVSILENILFTFVLHVLLRRDENHYKC